MIPRPRARGLPAGDGPATRVAAFLLLVFLARISLIPLPACAAASLKLVTINVWSGLDYEGTWRMGEYETAERREKRFQALVRGIRDLGPDVIFLQEANPLPGYARRLAATLGFTEVHQVCNGGIRIGSLGIPSNLREGLVILAHPSLRLRKTGAWKLHGPAGLFRDSVTFHLREARFALAGEIDAGGVPFLLVNVHLGSAPSPAPVLDVSFRAAAAAAGFSGRDVEKALRNWKRGVADREREISVLLAGLARLPSGGPVVVAGDFNARPGDPEMVRFREEGGFTDALAAADVKVSPGTSDTWDPAGNGNVSFSTRATDARGRRLDAYGLLKSLWDASPRRIDFIFLGKGSATEGATTAGRVVFDALAGDVLPSDHYGVFAEIVMPGTGTDGSRGPGGGPAGAGK